LFGIWISLTVGVLTWLDSATGILALALLSLSSLIILLQSLGIIGWILILSGAFVYGFAEFSFWGFSNHMFVTVCAYLVGLLGLILFGKIVLRYSTNMSQQVHQLQQVVNELTMHGSSGLVKWQYARINLKLEILRSQRYKRPLCLFFLQIKNWDEITEDIDFDASEDLLNHLSSLLTDALRNVDTASQYDDTTYGVILPETSREGCHTVIHRFHETVEQKMRMALNTGVSVFPDDGVEDNQIIAAAETALQYSITSRKSIVFFSDLGMDDEKITQADSKSDISDDDFSGQAPNLEQSTFPPDLPA
jgi:diguanylate cyclase (GGDEF)-like protein